ncbi:MAG: hypothetical protein WCD70_00720 [Alphaproteobacteria bacterium]
MKNSQLLVTKADIHDYVGTLWQTDAFRNSHKKNGVVFDVVDKFAILPRLFCESTNDKLERAHFSTWWGAMMKRDDYTNPSIADLYLIHEFYHAATMPYVSGIGKAAFNEKMARNELEASVFSEIQIYFEMPGLRESSFAYPIYADRFIKNPDLQTLWQHNKQIAIETLRVARRDVMVSKPEYELDIAEQWIRRFAEQNDAYSITWSDRYSEIEKHMYDFQLASMTGSRQDALSRHRDWIEAEAAKDPKDSVPFRLEAELFTAFYWANKAKYQVAMTAEAERLKQVSTRPSSPPAQPDPKSPTPP